METLYFIAGLGNPGSEYANTRHNAGFSVVERLASRWHAVWKYEKRFKARLTWAERGARKVLLGQPQTFMNLSGESVGVLAQFYRIDLGRVLVIVDDADLPLGSLRLRPGGSSGGHHGLESVEQHLGSRDYARLRVGIGRRDSRRDIAGHVLGRFGSTETDLADKILTVAADQAETWLTAGIQQAMSRYNGAPLGGESADEGKAQ